MTLTRAQKSIAEILGMLAWIGGQGYDVDAAIDAVAALIEQKVETT